MTIKTEIRRKGGRREHGSAAHHCIVRYEDWWQTLGLEPTWRLELKIWIGVRYLETSGDEGGAQDVGWQPDALGDGVEILSGLMAFKNVDYCS